MRVLWEACDDMTAVAEALGDSSCEGRGHVGVNGVRWLCGADLDSEGGYRGMGVHGVDECMACDAYVDRRQGFHIRNVTAREIAHLDRVRKLWLNQHATRPASPWQ